MRRFTLIDRVSSVLMHACTVASLTKDDEWALIEPVLRTVSFVRPTVPITPARSEAVPKVIFLRPIELKSISHLSHSIVSTTLFLRGPLSKGQPRRPERGDR